MPTETTAPAPQSTAPASAPAKPSPTPSQPSGNLTFEGLSSLPKRQPRPETPKPEQKPAETPAAPTPEAKKTAEDEIRALVGGKLPLNKPDETPQDKAPEPSPGDKPAPSDQKTDGQPQAQKPPAVAQLRDAYETVKKENVDLRAKLSEFEKRPTEFPEKKALVEELESLRKKRDQLDQELQFADFTRSDKYKSDYEEPIIGAFQTAYGDMQQLVVTTEEGEREATAEDFNKIFKAPLKEANRLAKEMFPDTFSDVLAHRRKIIEMMQKRDKAVDEYRTKGSEAEKARQTESVRQQELLKHAWENSVNSAIKEYPDFYAQSEGDQQGNQLLENGYQLADIAFFGGKDISKEEMVKICAEVRNRAGAFGRMVHRNNQLQERVESLEQELQTFRKSEPKSGEPPTGDETKSKTFEDEIKSLIGK